MELNEKLFPLTKRYGDVTYRDRIATAVEAYFNHKILRRCVIGSSTHNALSDVIFDTHIRDWLGDDAFKSYKKCLYAIMTGTEAGLLSDMANTISNSDSPFFKETLRLIAVRQGVLEDRCYDTPSSGYYNYYCGSGLVSIPFIGDFWVVGSGDATKGVGISYVMVTAAMGVYLRGEI